MPTFQPFTDLNDERFYRFHKIYAESYTTNLRNLEAPWKPVIASILEAIVKKVCDPSIYLTVQQEQPIASPALAAAAVNADSTMTASNHKGTVYPDVSVIRYLLDVDNFRNLMPTSIDHTKIDYLICAELKRSVKGSHIRAGLDSDSKSYWTLMKYLRDACTQASRQAFVAMKRPNEANSDIILLASSGPFWMWCLATRVQMLGIFPGKQVKEILVDAQLEREEDDALERLDLDPRTEVLQSSAIRPMTKEAVFLGHPPDLPWSDVIRLDTKGSQTAFRTLQETLATIIQKK